MFQLFMEFCSAVTIFSQTDNLHPIKNFFQINYAAEAWGSYTGGNLLVWKYILCYNILFHNIFPLGWDLPRPCYSNYGSLCARYEL